MGPLPARLRPVPAPVGCAASARAPPLASHLLLDEMVLCAHLKFVEVFMHSLKYVGVALTAGIVGAAVALLLAPQSGRETRRKLGRRFEEESRRMSRTLQNEKQNLMKKGREALDDVAEYVNDELTAAQKKISKMLQA